MSSGRARLLYAKSSYCHGGCAAANAETLGAGVFEASGAEEHAESVDAEILAESLEAGRV